MCKRTPIAECYFICFPHQHLSIFFFYFLWNIHVQLEMNTLKTAKISPHFGPAAQEEAYDDWKQWHTPSQSYIRSDWLFNSCPTTLLKVRKKTTRYLYIHIYICFVSLHLPRDHRFRTEQQHLGNIIHRTYTKIQQNHKEKLITTH